jgi:hypothetical protein
MTPATIPPYGSRTLAEVVPAILARVRGDGGDAGSSGGIPLPDSSRACLVLIDGLGTRLLERAADADAPFLRSLLPTAIRLSSGFPSSTPISLCTLGTGRPPGEHGIVGFFLRPSADPGVIECLTWSEPGSRRTMLGRYPPEVLQPFESALATGRSDGVRTSIVSIAAHARSGLTRAAFRGAPWLDLADVADIAERVARLREALAEPPAVAYTYDPRLDWAAHRAGVDSVAWREALRATDGMLRAIRDALPPSTLLLVTGDHGAVDVADDWRIDLADRPDLLRDVETVTGDARARHIHAVAGRAADVAEAWRDGLDPGSWAVLTRDEAIDAGLFGVTVRDAVRDRVGDVVAAAIGREILLDRGRYPWEASFRSYHGGLTPDEVDVPLLIAEG